LAGVGVLTEMVCAITQVSGAEFMVVSPRNQIDVVGSPSHVVRYAGHDGRVIAERELVGQAPGGSCRSTAGLLVSAPRGAGVSVHDRHLAAVARSFGWAEEAAARGDYADALSWVGVVEAIGDVIPIEYQTKRRAWLGALAENRA
jgi:hypothetical protein